MDFELSSTQRALLEALDTLLDRHAGTERSRELAELGAYDRELEAALREGGFEELFGAEEAGPLDATLAVERIAMRLGAVTPVPRMLVLPALGLEPPEGPVVLAVAGDPGPIRYGAQATRMLLADGPRCVLAELDPDTAEPVPSAYGYPLARPVSRKSRELGPGTAAAMMNWWRVGVSAEAVGMMRQAMDIAVTYAKDRKVFGRALGSFQALQHRLAELSVAVEGARWLVYEAAFSGARAESAAVAAAHTMAALGRVTRETHQIMGAVGLTTEHDLHLWTLRMQTLRTELGGRRGHDRAVVAARWGRAS
ncbi:acyl-CoA dehydrogenase family protein [Sciscionella marina]|uniref:acyl-CoA dehydrogenase family protein n=1 Tax=Sciscionella marina TaxID=508770 RepID=UPI00037B8E9B|nr:acyl-CoA dehydrogenase family protein [Sciscionella marina]